MQGQTSFPQNKSIDITPIKKTLLNLMNKVFEGNQLNEKEFNFIIEIVKLNPNILSEIGFSPENIYELIEKNEPLASAIYVNISDSHGYEDYLKFFLLKKFSINTMKTFNKLIQRIEFPSIFIMAYLKKVILEFKNELNKQQKERMAKLIGYFILNLLNHEHITIDIIPTTINFIFNENYDDKEIKILQEKIYAYRNTKNNI